MFTTTFSEYFSSFKKEAISQIFKYKTMTIIFTQSSQDFTLHKEKLT